jgi:hypothetical protein
LNPSIQIENGKLIVRNVVIDDTETFECFRDVKREDLENRFKLAVKVGIIALRTIGTTERVDYIQKEFNRLDTRFNEVLQKTADQLSQNMDDLFGEGGTLPTILEENFGEKGKINSVMENHLGDKGTFSEQLEKHFGKNGLIVKELFDPLKEGTPLYQLKTILADELRSIKEALAIEEAKEEARQKSTQKGRDFEDVCEDLLGNVVRSHKSDVFQRTTTVKGQITNSKKGDFIVDVAGKSESRFVIEAKDWDNLTLPKINQEIDEALKNRGAKFGVFVARWNEAMPSSVGCFNYYNDDRVVCSLGSKDDEVLHEEILQAAYCWARANVLRKSASCDKVDFDLIDNNLNQIKSHLDLFNTIKNHCANITTSSNKIVGATDDIEAKIKQHLRIINGEMRKGLEKELEK